MAEHFESPNAYRRQNLHRADHGRQVFGAANLISEQVRRPEYEAVRAWIFAAVRDPALVQAETAETALGPVLPPEVIRHARLEACWRRSSTKSGPKWAAVRPAILRTGIRSFTSGDTVCTQLVLVNLLE